MADCGLAVAAAIQKYQITNINKQLIVVLDDPGVLPGALWIQDHSDLKGFQTHEGLVSMAKVFGTLSFNKFRIGVGKPSAEKTLRDHVLGSFTKEDQREMDMFGYALDVTAQALQHYACLGDIQKTKKKFSNIKKLPKTLRKVDFLFKNTHSVDGRSWVSIQSS
jgi:peptidyl-tRNA hydrolase